VTPPSGLQFELEHGDQKAVVVEVGGGLRSYSIGGADVLDGYGVDELCPSGRGQLLIPWPNRLEDGRYEFGGETHQLPLDEPEHGNAIHGLVRWAPWTATTRTPERVVLEHTLYPRPGYPFSLSLRAEYTLSADGLRVETTATNFGTATLPYGAGAHPYLTLGTPTVDELTLLAPAATVLRSDDRGLPIGEERVDGTELDFRRARAVGDTQLDHAFTDLERGADGLARVVLTDPSTGDGLTLWVDKSYGYLMLFTGDPLPDVARRSIAVEPMTSPPNAFRTGRDVIHLAPGESVTSAWGIAPTSSPQGDAAAESQA
jgi:aldose 1-epimerase